MQLGVLSFRRLLVPSFICWIVMGWLGINLAASHVAAQDRWNTSGDRSRDVATSVGNMLPGTNWLGGVSQQRQWRLGVVGANTETGVLVQTVDSRSAAGVANIEPGDLIVNVGGYQVGLVDGRAYDMDEEVNRQADTNGMVSIVVQDHRTGRLASVRLQLKGSDDFVRGTIQYRGRSLPADAIVTVNIENRSRPHYQVLQKNNRFLARGTGGDIPFEVAYDPSYIEAQDIYEIRATITSSGRTIFDTAKPQRVITRGNPKQAILQLVSLEDVASTPFPSGTTAIQAGYPNYNQVADQISTLYQRYLGRRPESLELIAWQSEQDLASVMKRVPITLMASQEFFDRVGNNSTVWIQSVFTEIVGKQPSQQELEGWLTRYAQLRNSR
ncbi:MAG: YbaY family lipoprotein, partial [Planctomycetales bacterium]|nr:YbaY family lipoprotein [Planctomycetales bacterium]